LTSFTGSTWTHMMVQNKYFISSSLAIYLPFTGCLAMKSKEEMLISYQLAYVSIFYNLYLLKLCHECNVCINLHNKFKFLFRIFEWNLESIAKNLGSLYWVSYNLTCYIYCFFFAKPLKYIYIFVCTHETEFITIIYNSIMMLSL